MYWLFSSKKTVTKKRNLSENLSFQNLLKNRKLLPAEKFGNILTFDKESKRKLLSLISAVLLKIIYIYIISAVLLKIIYIYITLGRLEG